MTQKVDAGPRDIGVRKKLWLLPSSPTDASSGKSDIRPYQQAIEQLRCIKDHYTMLSKLECVGEKLYLSSFIFIYVCSLYAKHCLGSLLFSLVVVVVSFWLGWWGWREDVVVCTLKKNVCVCRPSCVYVFECVVVCVCVCVLQFPSW